MSEHTLFGRHVEPESSSVELFAGGDAHEETLMSEDGASGQLRRGCRDKCHI